MLCAFEGITDILPPFGWLLFVIHLIIKEAISEIYRMSLLCHTISKVTITYTEAILIEV